MTEDHSHVRRRLLKRRPCACLSSPACLVGTQAVLLTPAPSALLEPSPCSSREAPSPTTPAPRLVVVLPWPLQVWEEMNLAYSSHEIIADFATAAFAWLESG